MQIDGQAENFLACPFVIKIAVSDAGFGILNPYFLQTTGLPAIHGMVVNLKTEICMEVCHEKDIVFIVDAYTYAFSKCCISICRG